MSLLDDYLNSDDSMGAAKAIPDDDFDSQLLGGAYLKGSIDGPDTAVIPQAKSGLDVKALLADAFKKAGEQQERDDEVRSGVKMASHGVRVLGSLYGSIIKNIDYNDSEQVASLMQSALGAVREDAFKITQACGLADNEVPAWLHSQISGQVMELMTSALERNNGSISGARKTQYLQPLIEAIAGDGANGIGATFYSNPDDPNLQLTNALMMATAGVMAEYQSFTYFNSDAKAVARQVTDVLKTRVIDETLNNLTDEWSLSPSERAYIGTTLISHAGKLMASSWSNNMLPTLEYVKALEADERRATLVSGFPLNVIFDEFDNFYGGLEVSAQASLELLRSGAGKSDDLAVIKKQSPSPRVG